MTPDEAKSIRPDALLKYTAPKDRHKDGYCVVLDVNDRRMIVSFFDRADTTTIKFHEPEWMDNLRLINQPPDIRKSGGKYTVILSNVGNPDFRQDCTKPLPGTKNHKAHVDSFGEAVTLCREYIAYHDLGGGNWNGGAIFDNATKKQVARVSYNGRVWDMNDNEIGMHGMKGFSE